MAWWRFDPRMRSSCVYERHHARLKIGLKFFRTFSLVFLVSCLHHCRPWHPCVVLIILLSLAASTTSFCCVVPSLSCGLVGPRTFLKSQTCNCQRTNRKSLVQRSVPVVSSIFQVLVYLYHCALVMLLPLNVGFVP